MKYVVVDVGCIECGEESAVLGIFTDKKKAEETMKKCEEYQSAHWMGQHYFFIEEKQTEENEENFRDCANVNGYRFCYRNFS